MNLEQAVEIVDKALNVAVLKGAFGLQDAAVLNQALSKIKDAFNVPVVTEDVAPDTQEVVEDEA